MDFDFEMKIWELLIQHRRKLCEIANFAVETRQDEIVKQLDEQIEEISKVMKMLNRI